MALNPLEAAALNAYIEDEAAQIAAAVAVPHAPLWGYPPLGYCVACGRPVLIVGQHRPMSALAKRHNTPTRDRHIKCLRRPALAPAILTARILEFREAEERVGERNRAFREAGERGLTPHALAEARRVIQRAWCARKMELLVASLAP